MARPFAVAALQVVPLECALSGLVAFVAAYVADYLLVVLVPHLVYF